DTGGRPPPRQTGGTPRRRPVPRFPTDESRFAITRTGPSSPPPRPPPPGPLPYVRTCFTSSYACITRLRIACSIRKAVSAFSVARITPSTSSRLPVTRSSTARSASRCAVFTSSSVFTITSLNDGPCGPRAAPIPPGRSGRTPPPPLIRPTGSLIPTLQAPPALRPGNQPAHARRLHARSACAQTTPTLSRPGTLRQQPQSLCQHRLRRLRRRHVRLVRTRR